MTADTYAKQELIPMSDGTVTVLQTHHARLVPVDGVYHIDGARTCVEFVRRRRRLHP